MARVPMVTRTIITTNAKILCVNTATKEVSEVSVTLPRTYKDEEEILKAIKKLNVSLGENNKPISVVGYETTETLYGMTEAEFVSVAFVLPPRNAGEDNEETSEAVAEDKKSKKSKK